MRYRSINDSTFSIAIQLNGYYIATVRITSPPQSHFGRAASPPLTAENGLARCVC